jgi:hypothetical protein
MAQVIKDGSARGQRYPAVLVKKPETMIIPARELVQVFAKVSFSIPFLLVYGLQIFIYYSFPNYYFV